MPEIRKNKQVGFLANPKNLDAFQTGEIAYEEFRGSPLLRSRGFSKRVGLSLLTTRIQYRKLSAKKIPTSILETKIGANHDETIFSNNYKHTPGRKKKLEIRTPIF